LLIVVCALYLSGVHWALLQTTAWTGMLVARSQEAGVMNAVETTFDGLHPCSLCKVIKEVQKDEQKSESQTLILKKLMEAKFIAVAAIGLPLLKQTDSARWQDFSENGKKRVDAPFTPPPLV